MKKVSVITWVRTITFLILLCVAVFCGDFLYTGESLPGQMENTDGQAVTQYFTPKHAYLAGVKVAVEKKQTATGKALAFRLRSADAGKLLFEQEIPWSAVVEGWYLEFAVNQRVDTKADYVLEISLEDAASDEGITLCKDIYYEYNVISPVRVALFLIILVAVIVLFLLQAFLPEKEAGKEWNIGEFLAAPFFKTGYSVINVAMFCAVTLGGIGVRLAFLPVKSVDYYLCYEDWLNEIRQLGGIESIGHVIGNYTPLFMLVLGLLSYLPFEPVVIIKLTPCIFDFILALLSVRFLKMLGVTGIVEKITLYAFMLFNPICFLNSAAWGQCDVVYTVFILCALYGLCRNDSGKWYATGDGICVLFGIAFCLKLQALFFVPVLGLVWITQRRNRLKPVHLLWVPGLYILSCIPAYLQGRSLKQMFKIYLSQSSGDYGGLSINYPNLYSMVGGQNSALRDSFFVLGLLLAFFVLLFLYYWIYSRQMEVGGLLLCKAAAATVLILCFFLPSIHERYAYIGEMLLGILMIAEPKYRKIAAVTVLCTTVTYCTFLYQTEFSFAVFPEWLMALARFVCIVSIVRDIMQPGRTSADRRECGGISG